MSANRPPLVPLDTLPAARVRRALAMARGFRAPGVRIYCPPTPEERQALTDLHAARLARVRPLLSIPGGAVMVFAGGRRGAKR